MLRIRTTILACLVGLLFTAAPGRAADRAVEISFDNDVMPVLGKAGCNAGVCHGNANGKGGFKLSLRGESPEFDCAALSHAVAGRRINPLEPKQSLVLLKPTMQLPHEGGRRFGDDSPEYDILLRWISAGMPRDSAGSRILQKIEVTPAEVIITEPEDHVPLHVAALYSDGSRRDVTRFALFEPVDESVTVTREGRVDRQRFGETTVVVRYLNRQVPVRLAFLRAQPSFVFTSPPPANFVDEHIFAKLRALRMNPSAVADDTVFLRRATLDLLGFLPSADEARRFVADANPRKREELIKRLLERPEFADFWALKWSDLLRNEETTLDRKGVQNFHAWIRDGIAHGKPLDQFARELIAARGSTYTNPEANFYRAMREPLMRGESAAQLFLGVRLQCAKCHNHPFDRWTQDDYYGWANLFARVKYKVLENRRRDKNNSHEFDGEQIVYMDGKGEVVHPRLGRPIAPRFLSDDATPAAPDAEGDRLTQLAAWATNPRNKRFAKTQANRIWFQLMGRGIVDPVDDFRLTNPPSNPKLLDALTDALVSSKFDLKHMIRTIMNSRAYQLSSTPNATNAGDEANFSHAAVRRLSAEQILDSVSRIADEPIPFNGYPLGLRAGEIPGVRAVGARDGGPSRGDKFLIAFGKPPRLQPCECERSDETTLGQAFQLISGELMNGLLTAKNGRLRQLALSKEKGDVVVSELYWWALSRPPSKDELRVATPLVDAGDRGSAVEDILWALCTSNEFLMRR